MKLFKLLFSRLGITAIMVILEIVYLVSLLQWLSPYIGWITGILQVISIFIILWIINQSRLHPQRCRKYRYPRSQNRSAECRKASILTVWA